MILGTPLSKKNFGRFAAGFALFERARSGLHSAPTEGSGFARFPRSRSVTASANFPFNHLSDGVKQSGSNKS
jgi:hypothetical protein